MWYSTFPWWSSQALRKLCSIFLYCGYTYFIFTQAGRIHRLDELAIQFIKDKDSREKTHAEAQGYAEENGSR